MILVRRLKNRERELTSNHHPRVRPCMRHATCDMRPPCERVSLWIARTTGSAMSRIRVIKEYWIYGHTINHPSPGETSTNSTVSRDMHNNVQCTHQRNNSRSKRAINKSEEFLYLTKNRLIIVYLQVWCFDARIEGERLYPLIRSYVLQNTYPAF